MKVKEESEKVGLKLNIQKTKIMATGLARNMLFMGNRWGNCGNRETLYFGELQNHCRCDYNHEIKRHLLFGRKAMTILDSIVKSRDITLPTNICLVKAMVLQVVMYGCKS